MSTAPDNDHFIRVKYSGLRDSLLHWLCNAGWGNESDGNAPDYGSYFTRIELTWNDVRPTNIEFTSLLECWAEEEEIDADRMENMRLAIVGYWMVSEDAHGFVHVREFPTPGDLKRRYDQFAEHYANWTGPEGGVIDTTGTGLTLADLEEHHARYNQPDTDN